MAKKNDAPLDYMELDNREFYSMLLQMQNQLVSAGYDVAWNEILTIMANKLWIEICAEQTVTGNSRTFDETFLPDPERPRKFLSGDRLIARLLPSHIQRLQNAAQFTANLERSLDVETREQ